MNKVQQFLMAGAVLSGVAWLQATEARVENDTGGKLALVSRPGMMLAQAQEPESKPGVTPQKPPVGTPGKPQAVAPARRTPPKAQGAPPAAPPAAQEQAPSASGRSVTPPKAQGSAPAAPPAAQGQQPAVPGRPVTPPKAQSAPPAAPPSAQGQPPAMPGKPVAPPAAQSVPPAPPPAAQEQAPASGRSVTPPKAQGSAPAAPPAAQGQQPAVPGRPVTPPKAQSAPPAAPPVAPPAAQSVPPAPPPAAQEEAPASGRPVTAPAPPAAQGQPPAAPGRPVASPAAQSAPPPHAGITPNMQAAPLTPAGVPIPSAQQAHPIAPAAAGAGIAPQSAQGQPLRRIEELRGERRESTESGRTIIREPDRTIITEGGQTIIRHSEVDRFRYGAQDVRMERHGNDTVTVVIRPDGDRVVTTLDENGFLLRRSRILPDGREIIIIDNRPRGPGRGYSREAGYGGFFVDLPPPMIRIPRDRYIVETETATPTLLYETLVAPPVDVIDRPYSLDEIRYSAPLRDRMPRIDLNTVTFDSGSWELSPDQIEQLAGIAASLNRAIEVNPREVFLIEGYTDAVGSDVDNLSLSDRRAESVAIVLTQQFGVPAENLSTQGYGKQYLKVPTDGPERANRRVTVRRITPLLTGQVR
jgi:OmpA-OmpF porin, OOP family